MANQYKPLEGIRVVELSYMVAGPSAGRYLAEWGAEVIKVEKKSGDTFRFYPRSMGMPIDQDCNPLYDLVNGGKRDVVFDITKPEGMEAFDKLLATADVFLTSNRPKSLKKNGLDYETLSKKYPRLVYALLSSYGLTGPRKNEPGQDTISFWAATGFNADMMTVTENGGGYPVYGNNGAGDLVTGLGLAYAIVCALFKREKTGEGDFVVNSLFGMGLWTTSEYNIGSLPQYSWVMPKTRLSSAAGSSPFKCKDGEWFMAVCPNVEFDWPKFANAVGRPDWINDRFGTTAGQADLDNRAYLMTECEKIFASKTSKEWDEIFTKADVTHCVLAHYGDFATDVQAHENHYAFEVEYNNGHKVQMIRPAMSSFKMGVPEFKRASMTGEDTNDVLKELGYTDEQVSSLNQTGAVQQIDAAKFNPGLKETEGKLGE